MSVRKPIFTASVIAVAVLGMSACSSSAGSSSAGGSGTATSTTNLTFAVAAATFGPKEEVATYSVAEQYGYFKAAGVNVNVIPTNGSSAALQAVVSGSAQVGEADGGTILAAVSKGVPVVALGVEVQNWPWRIAVQPGSSIKGAADLKGKKIGVISLASGSAPYAKAFLQDNGVDANSAQLLPVGVGAEAANALSSHKVDALALYTQAYQAIENTGTKFRFLDNPSNFDDIVSQIFITSKSELKKDPQAIAGFLRGAYQGLVFSSTNPVAAMRAGYKSLPQILGSNSESSQLAGDVEQLKVWLASATPKTGTPATWPSWGAISPAQWDATQQFAKFSGQITSTLPESTFYDSSLLASANKFDTNAVIATAKKQPTS